MSAEIRRGVAEDVAGVLRPKPVRRCQHRESGDDSYDPCSRRATFWTDDMVPGFTVWLCDAHADEWLLGTDGGDDDGE